MLRVERANGLYTFEPACVKAQISPNFEMTIISLFIIDFLFGRPGGLLRARLAPRFFALTGKRTKPYASLAQHLGL